MIDHRRVQRTLLRMQLDPGFAAALLAREERAVASTGLGDAELALFQAADPRAIAADRDGARRAQFLRNATGEFALSLAVAGIADLAEGFLASPEFHGAVAEGACLAAAFARHAARRAREEGDPPLAAIVQLESAMAEARRTVREVPALAPGEVALAAHARLCVLPAGTFALAEVLRQALDRGEALGDRELPALELERDARETVLLVSRPAGAHRLRGVEAERLEPLVAALLARTERPFGAAAGAAFAAEHAVEPGEVDGFAASLVEEGVLVRA